MKLSNRIALPIGIILASSLGLGALTLYVLKEPHAVTPAPVSQPQPTANSKSAAIAPRSAGQTYYAYLPKMTKAGIVFDQIELKSQSSADPMADAMNEFLADTHIAPPDARCVSTEIKDGVATVNFNEAFRQTYGSFDEKLLLDGIRRNASQFEKVGSIVIEVNGQPLDTLGSGDLSKPLPTLTTDQDLFSDSDSSGSDSPAQEGQSSSSVKP